MTMLLVDLGNSRLKWALSRSGEVREPQALVHEGEFSAGLFDCAWANVVPPTRLVLANVAGANAADALQAWVCERWGLRAEFVVATRSACGVVNGYTEPARLGIDRWAAMVAAHHRYDESVIVVDCGTAITVDAIAADGHHLGGLIAPGCMLMRHALDAGTVGVGPTAHRGVAALNLGADSQSGVASGVLHGALGFIERALATARRALHGVPQAVITGGDAAVLAPFLAVPYAHEPELVLAGLALLAEARDSESKE